MADTLLVVAEGIGTRRRTVSQHFGPASYTQVTFGPVAGGDVIPASALGLKTIETALVNDVADDGVKGVLAILVGKEPSFVTIGWYAAITLAAQVAPATNLSALSVRLEVTGLG